MSNKPDDTHSDKESARRRDEALRRALNTPPQPKLPPNRKKAEPTTASHGARAAADE